MGNQSIIIKEGIYHHLFLKKTCANDDGIGRGKRRERARGGRRGRGRITVWFKIK
jgi:hypothetical protein